MIGSLMMMKHIDITYYQYYLSDEQFFEVSKTYDYMEETTEYEIYQQAPYRRIMNDEPEYKEIIEAIKKELKE